MQLNSNSLNEILNSIEKKIEMQINVVEGIENLLVTMMLKKDTNLKRHFFIIYFGNN